MSLAELRDKRARVVDEAERAIREAQHAGDAGGVETLRTDLDAAVKVIDAEIAAAKGGKDAAPAVAKARTGGKQREADRQAAHQQSLARQAAEAEQARLDRVEEIKGTLRQCDQAWARVQEANAEVIRARDQWRKAEEQFRLSIDEARAELKKIEDETRELVSSRGGLEAELARLQKQA